MPMSARYLTGILVIVLFVIMVKKCRRWYNRREIQKMLRGDA